MATFPVKHFHSGMPGAPVLSGTAGALIAVLDACLLNGFGLQTATSVVISGGIATATLPAAPAAAKDSIILVTGATPAGLNGEQRVTSAASNSVAWATTEADGTATGTITIKLAPLGWAKAFTATNIAAYKASDVASTGMLLRVDDSGTTNARVVGYEAMTDANTGVASFPLASQMSGGGYWGKSWQANATARPWFVAGDSRAFFLCVAPGIYSDNYTVHQFGDFVSNKSGDAYGCALACNAGDRTANATITECLGYSGKANYNTFIARASNALGGSVGAVHIGAMNISNVDAYSANPAYGPFGYPNNADNGLLFCKLLVQSGGGLRGVFPGIYHVPQNAQDAFVSGATVAPTDPALAGRTLRALRVGASSNSWGANSVYYGVVFFDITGPWR